MKNIPNEIITVILQESWQADMLLTYLMRRTCKMFNNIISNLIPANLKYFDGWVQTKYQKNIYFRQRCILLFFVGQKINIELTTKLYQTNKLMISPTRLLDKNIVDTINIFICGYLKSNPLYYEQIKLFVKPLYICHGCTNKNCVQYHLNYFEKHKCHSLVEKEYCNKIVSKCVVYLKSQFLKKLSKNFFSNQVD